MDGGSNKPKCHLKAQKPRIILYLGIPYTPPCRHQYVCMKLCPLMASITQMPPFPFMYVYINLPNMLIRVIGVSQKRGWVSFSSITLYQNTTKKIIQYLKYLLNTIETIF